MLLQASGFGAFLDVFIDNLSRAMLWVWAIEGPCAVLPPLFEMTAFVCTHKVFQIIFPQKISIGFKF